MTLSPYFLTFAHLPCAGLGTSHTQHVVSQHQNKPWEWYQFPERDKLKSGAKLNSCLQSLFLLSSQAGQSAVNKRLGTVVETHIFAEVEAAVGPLTSVSGTTTSYTLSPHFP